MTRRYGRALHRAIRRHRARLLADQITRGGTISQADVIRMAQLWAEKQPGIRTRFNDAVGLVGYRYDPALLTPMSDDPRVAEALRYVRDGLASLPPQED